MKRFIKKVHHFTKRELAAEEIIIIVVVCVLFTAACLAGTALLPIRVTLVQCGSRQELPAKCREDSRCCALLEETVGPSSQPDSDSAGASNTPDMPEADRPGEPTFDEGTAVTE